MAARTFYLDGVKCRTTRSTRYVVASLYRPPTGDVQVVIHVGSNNLDRARGMRSIHVGRFHDRPVRLFDLVTGEVVP